MRRSSIDEDWKQALRERLTRELIPRVKRARRQVAVAMHIVSIVERQIGRGEPPREEDWDRLRKLVKGNEAAAKLASNLEAALQKYEEDLRAKLRDAEVDEARVRKATQQVVVAALVAKLKALLEREAHP
jgi:hypothetical protein